MESHPFGRDRRWGFERATGNRALVALTQSTISFTARLEVSLVLSCIGACSVNHQQQPISVFVTRRWKLCAIALTMWLRWWPLTRYPLPARLQVRIKCRRWVIVYRTSPKSPDTHALIYQQRYKWVAPWRNAVAIAHSSANPTLFVM